MANEPSVQRSAVTTPATPPARTGGQPARARLRTATIAGGVGAVLVLVLLALAAVRGSVALAVTAVVVGAALVAGACWAVLQTV